MGADCEPRHSCSRDAAWVGGVLHAPCARAHVRAFDALARREVKPRMKLWTAAVKESELPPPRLNEADRAPHPAAHTPRPSLAPRVSGGTRSLSRLEVDRGVTFAKSIVAIGCRQVDTPGWQTIARRTCFVAARCGPSHGKHAAVASAPVPLGADGDAPVATRARRQPAWARGMESNRVAILRSPEIGPCQGNVW